MRLARCLLIAALCLLAATGAQAQRAPTPDEVRARLHSGTPAEVAWAALEVGTSQMVEAAPAFIAALDPPPAGSSLERVFLAAAFLDSLIQLKPPPGIPNPRATAPAEILGRYYDRWPIQTLVL